MPRYKITQSLLSAWYYVHDCWEGCEDDAMEEFLHALRCEPEELTDEQKQNIQNGHDFEELIESIANGADWETDKEHKWYRAAYELAQIVKGAQFQVRVRKPITINGMEFEIVGVLDALREVQSSTSSSRTRASALSILPATTSTVPSTRFISTSFRKPTTSCIWFLTEMTSTSSDIPLMKPEALPRSFPSLCPSSRLQT